MKATMFPPTCKNCLLLNREKRQSQCSLSREKTTWNRIACQYWVHHLTHQSRDKYFVPDINNPRQDIEPLVLISPTKEGKVQ